MKSVQIAGAVAAVGTLLVSGSVALAASTHAQASSTARGGEIHIAVTDFHGTKAKITIVGAIGDYGTITSETKAGKPSENGTYQHAQLKHGTLVIDTTAYNKALDHARPQVNESTCAVYFTGGAPTTIISGTGEYAGAHGTVKVTATFEGIVARKNGKCDVQSNATPGGAFDVLTGSGTISFS